MLLFLHLLPLFMGVPHQVGSLVACVTNWLITEHPDSLGLRFSVLSDLTLPGSCFKGCFPAYPFGFL